MILSKDNINMLNQNDHKQDFFSPLARGDDYDWGSVSGRSQISECNSFIAIQEEEPLFHFPSPPYQNVTCCTQYPQSSPLAFI